MLDLILLLYDGKTLWISKQWEQNFKFQNETRVPAKTSKPFVANKHSTNSKNMDAEFEMQQWKIIQQGFIVIHANSDHFHYEF